MVVASDGFEGGDELGCEKRAGEFFLT